MASATRAANGRGSYSTSIAAIASSARSSVSAATIATTVPGKLVSSGMKSSTAVVPLKIVVMGAFRCVSTYATPGIFSAFDVSRLLIRARGCGQVRILVKSMFGRTILVAYSAFPRNLGIATSGMGVRGFPITFRFTGGYPCHFFVRIPFSIRKSAGPCPPAVEKSLTTG